LTMSYLWLIMNFILNYGSDYKTEHFNKPKSKMKTRYNVCKAGWIEEHPVTYKVTEHNSEVLNSTQSEAEAIRLLEKLDEDWHYIEKEIYVHVQDGYYDWETEEGYECKYLYDLLQQIKK